MIFLRDEVQAPSVFFVHHFVPLLTRACLLGFHERISVV
jgi:hypothetical protein